jgi:hypothetical protein
VVLTIQSSDDWRTFTDEPLRAALEDHKKRAMMVLDLEEKFAAAVKKLRS